MVQCGKKSLFEIWRKFFIDMKFISTFKYNIFGYIRLKIYEYHQEYNLYYLWLEMILLVLDCIRQNYMNIINLSVLPIIRIDHINTKEYIFVTRCMHLSQWVYHTSHKI